MNLEEINKLRDEQRNIDRSQSKLLVEFLKQQDEFWEFQGLAEQVAFDKNQSDMLLVSNQIYEWSLKAKDENKKLFEDLYLKSIRISGYVFHLETVSKQSIRLYRDEIKQNKRLLSEKKGIELKFRQMELEKNAEIENLKKQLEFYEKNK